MNQQNGGRRLDGYIRVSSIRGREGDLISPQVQEDKIRGWASLYGHEIVEVFHELDVSGGRMDRPMLNEVMARIDSGESEGVVVLNITRFGRNLIGASELIRRIHGRGALFASVQDNFDITTANGRLQLNLMLTLAEWQRETIGEGWLSSKSHAVGRGIHISANVPFGYRRPTETNPRTGKVSTLPLVPDPETAWVVPELFKRKAAGESWESLRRFLVANNLPTVRGASWSSSTVMSLIKNRVYLGEARGAEFPTLDAHPALIDEATWQAAQTRGKRFTINDSGGLLRGLLRCGSCRYTMQQSTAADLRRKGAIDYTCSSRVGCPAPARVIARGANGSLGIDEVVVELVRAEEMKRGKTVAFDRFDSALDIEADEQELAALVARREQDRLDEELLAALGRQEWTRHLADLSHRVNEKQDAIVEKQRQLGRPDGVPKEALWEKWDSGEMTLAEKRDHLAGALQTVFVKAAGGRTGFARMKDELRRSRLRDRVDLVWAWDPPLTEIPRQGHGGYVVTPWEFKVGPDKDGAGVMPLKVEMEDTGEAVG